MKNLILFVFVLNSLSIFSQTDSVSILFYNVENLFDTEDDTLKLDNEFLPNGKKKWNSTRWNQKTINITKVIAGNDFPEIIGLCEIENKNVLEKIKNHYILRNNE